jgi:hypothetical protein
MTYFPMFGLFSTKSFVAGAAVTVVGSLIARPLIVGVARAGYEVSDFVTDTWSKAKSEAQSVKEEARGGRSRNVEAELQELRDEVATLRAQAGKRSSAS